MRKYFAIKTLNCQKFNIVTDIWDRGVITETKPVVYGLNSDSCELFSICISAHFELSQELLITGDTFVTIGIS